MDRLDVSVPDNCTLPESYEADDMLDFVYGDQSELDIPLTCTTPVEPEPTPTTPTTAAPVTPTTATPVDLHTTGGHTGGVQVDTGEPSGMSTSGLVAGVGGATVIAGAIGASVALRRRNLGL